MATNQSVPSALNPTSIFKCDKHAVNMSKNIQILYEEQQLFDFTLIAGPERVKIQVHRFVLLTTSKYFWSMFRANLQEATATELELKEIDGDILKLIVEFLYTGSVELCTETVEGILKAADYLELPTLVVACSEFMGNRLDFSNCIGVALFAQQYNSAELYKQSTDFAYKNFEKVCQEREFLQMTSNQLKELLASDEACVPSEEIIFRGLMAWINHDKANREDLMPSLLLIVRFTVLTPQFISEHVAPVCETDGCPKLILKWLQWHLCPNCRTDLSNSLNTKPRRANTKAFVLSGADTYSLQLQTFDREQNEWCCIPLPKNLKQRVEFGAILKNGKLIITGGYCDDIELNTVECLDLVTMEWTPWPPMLGARSGHTMAELGGNLYVIGCATRNKLGFPMERYDFTTEKWKDLAPVPLDEFPGIKSTVLNGMLYICSLNNLLCYDPARNEWARLPKFVCPDFSGLVALGEYLYSVGGYDGKNLDCVKRFNPLTGESQELRSLISKRSDTPCYALNGRILVCGGFENKGFTEEYKPETDEWTLLSPMLNGECLYWRNSL